MLRVKELSWAITALFLLAALYIYGIRVFGSHGFAPGLTGAGSGQASTQATATTPTTQASATTTTSTTKTFATTQDRTAMTKQRELMAVSPKVSAELLTRADTRMEATIKRFDRNAAELGDARVAALLASRFGVSANALTKEHKKLHTSWGQLMIARRLAASCGNPSVTPQLLLQMKAHGMGWGRIASRLGLSVGSAVKSVKVEGRVANGLARSVASGSRLQVGGVRGGMSNTMGMRGGMHAGLGHFNRGIGLGRVKIK
jgi:hypothetical protein